MPSDQQPAANTSSHLMDEWRNDTDYAYNSAIQYEHVVRVVVPSIFGLIAVIGLVGNLLVILVVVSNKQMRNTTNILIINLAMADLLFIIICVPFTAVAYSVTVWPFGNVMCKCYQYFINVTAYVSVFTLVLMSLDRYLAVVHPITSMTWRTERNALIATSVLWAIMLILNIPILREYQSVPYTFASEQRSVCTDQRMMTEPVRAKLFYGTFFAFGFVLPLTTICILYGFMVHRLLYGGLPRGYQSAESLRSKKRVTRMIIVIVFIFAVCWLPVHIAFMLQHFSNLFSTTTTFVSFKIASTCLAYMNSCVNPLLYAFLSGNFRKSFQRLLCHGDRFEPVKTHVGGQASGGRLLGHMTPMTVLTESKPNLNGTV